MNTTLVDAEIIEIIENSFFVDREKISCNSGKIIPCFRLSILNNKEEELLMVNASVEYRDEEEKSLAETQFDIKLKVKGLKDFVKNTESGEEIFEFPNGFIETLIRDTYATGRVLSSSRFSGTRLEQLYLLLQGAEKLIDKILGKSNKEG